MKKILLFTLIALNILFFEKVVANTNDKLYEKIDLFGEVLEKIKQEYVDEIDQADVMDSAINGVLQSLDPYSAYMSPELFESMQTESKGEFGGLGIEIGMEAGVVKVISPISDTPAEKAGIKAGDIILEFNGTPIKEMKELPKIVAQTEVGKTVDVKIWRNKKEITKKIKLGRLETSDDFKEKPKEAETSILEIESLKIKVRLLNDKDITLIMISHNSNLRGKFDKKFKITKGSLEKV